MVRSPAALPQSSNCIISFSGDQEKRSPHGISSPIMASMVSSRGCRMTVGSHRGNTSVKRMLSAQINSRFVASGELGGRCLAVLLLRFSGFGALADTRCDVLARAHCSDGDTSRDLSCTQRRPPGGFRRSRIRVPVFGPVNVDVRRRFRSARNGHRSDDAQQHRQDPGRRPIRHSLDDVCEGQNLRRQIGQPCWRRH